jgi:hypothetical protein
MQTKQGIFGITENAVEQLETVDRYEGAIARHSNLQRRAISIL